MADQLPRNPSRSEEEYLPLTHKWYFTKEEIENCSPSRKDGISHEQESYLRKLYCSFIQELGVELKVPQVTIATAIILSHRFYMRQSHAKSHWQTIAAVSMFLACKAEETPRLLSDFVIVSYKLMYKWDPSAPQRIKQRDVYNQQKELLLLGERLLLATVAFDFNIEQPYKPLVGALKKLQIPHKELVKVAWNFVNDMLRTTLCLQYKPAYIAASSVSLAAKVLKVKLPKLNGNPWWLLFDVSPRRLEEVIQQMFTLVRQNQKQMVPSPSTGRMMTESKSKSDRTMVNSPESCISSLNVTAQNSSNTTLLDDERLARFSVPECTQEKSATDVQGGINEAERFQPSDHGSTNRIVEDGDGDGNPSVKERDLNPSCKIVSQKIDVNHIRELIKRRKTSELENQQVECTEDEIDSETLIERELENGKERDLNPSCEIISQKIDVIGIREKIKRRKMSELEKKRVEGTRDDIGSETLIKKELENGKERDLNPSCEIVSQKIDVNSIREKIKRRKMSELEKKRVEGTEDDIGSETLIKRELENGKERDLNPVVRSSARR